MEIIKVSSTSVPNHVAGAIARGYIIPTGKELICIPSFHDLMVDDKRITALRLVIELR